MDKVTTYTALCAQWEEFKNRTPQLASTITLIDSTLSAIRDLEAQLVQSGDRAAELMIQHMRRAEAAEAKLAEVERERDQAVATAEGDHELLLAEEEARRAAEATVATLTAQVEAMRVSAMKAMTIANGALDSTATEKTFRRDLVQIREELRGALWPATLTTENQTNG